MATEYCGRPIKEEKEECNAVQRIITQYELEPKQVKSEDVIDIVDHDLKCEEYTEEVKEASHCEVCGGGLLSPTDHSKFCSNCLCHNGSNSMQGEYMALDLKQLTSDPGIPLFKTQEETIVDKKEEIINENMLKRHEKIHTGKKPLQCKICFKSFIRNSVLKKHEMIHTGEKPFQCKICSKSFSRKGHEKTHTREKSFQCKICSKSFSRSGTLKIHEKIHTGEKPFQCTLCSKSFIQKNNWKRHEKNQSHSLRDVT
ncbi:uncharacterized protein [Leptinotarsa decemlineata]|uniref:uncharacterized protein n=1 Tax=Leptinotarsa decemlineata TaxID=7539 RepID=UPI003D30CE4B